MNGRVDPRTFNESWPRHSIVVRREEDRGGKAEHKKESVVGKQASITDTPKTEDRRERERLDKDWRNR